MQTDFTQEIKPYLQHHQIVKQKATSNEVIEEIVKVINENVNTQFTKLVVDKLSYGNPDNDTFVKRVFDYACYAVKYRKDPNGREIIFTPKLLITVGKGDCKKFTTFIAAVLKTKGIEPVLKVVSYSGHDWEHIYILYPKGNHYITVDPVNDETFNKEVQHSHYRLYYLNGTKSKIMSNQLESMGSHHQHIEEDSMMQGLGMSANSITHDLDQIANTGLQIFGIGCPMGDVDHLGEGIGSLGKKHKGWFKKLLNVAKKGAFVVPRASFLGMLMLGKALEHSPLKIHLAKHMVEHWNKDNGKALSKLWEDFGGDPKVLQRTILKGMQGTGVHGIEAMNDATHLDLNDNRPLVPGVNGIGFVTMAAVGGAITAALPIVVKVMSTLKKSGVIPEGSPAAEQVDRVVNTAADLYKDDGTHTVALSNNPVVTQGAQEIGDHAVQQVNAHTGGDAQAQYQNSTPPPDHLPPSTHSSMFNLNTPLSFNTWFKGTFLTFMYASITHEKIGVAAFIFCLTALLVTQSYKGIKFLIKHK